MKQQFDTSQFDEAAPIDGAVTPPSKPKPRGRGRSFSNPVPAEARRDVAKASGQGGDSLGTEKHKQLTFRIPWEWIDEIEQWTGQLGVSKEEMKRYLVRRGLDALRDGERPRVKPHVVRNTIEYQKR